MNALQVFTANEMATDLLVKGKHLEAARCFLQGLARLRAALDLEPEASEHNHDDGGVLDDMCQHRNQIFTIAITHTQSLCGSNTVDDKHSLDYFKRVFCLRLGSYWSKASTDVLSAISAILMFNAALSFHIEATRTGQSDLLRRALRIYSNCFVIINSAGVDIPLLSLATCSNMAHIQSEFFDANALQRTALSLSRLLAEQSSSLKMEEDEVVFFRVQALTCRLSKTRRAPAA